MKKYLIVKDFKRRKYVNKLEWKKKIFKFFYHNLALNLKVRQRVYFNILNLKKKTFSTRVKNFCILTGKSHSVYKKFKLSRMSLRESLSIAFLTGMKKSSW